MANLTHSGFWQKVQSCDPRVLYVIFFIILVVFEFIAPRIPTPVPDSVQALYDYIESLDGEKIVIVDCSLDSGFIAEGRGQYEVVIRHLFRKGIPVAISTNTMFNEGQKFATLYTEPIAEEMGKKYGIDYCIWSAWTPFQGAKIASLAKNIPGTVSTDINKTPLAEIPMMKDVADIYDVALIYRVAYTWDIIPWIGFVQAVYGTPFAVGTASISSSGAYPFVDSGQLFGLLPGAAGAAAYEQLLDSPGVGTRTTIVQSLSTLYVILAIFLGNVAMIGARIAGRRRRTR